MLALLCYAMLWYARGVQPILEQPEWLYSHSEIDLFLRASEAPERSEGGRPEGGPPSVAEGSSERGEVWVYWQRACMFFCYLAPASPGLSISCCSRRGASRRVEPHVSLWGDAFWALLSTG